MKAKEVVFNVFIGGWLAWGAVANQMALAEIFDFNGGTIQGWTLEGAFDEQGDGPFAENFSCLWWDRASYPGTPGADPVGNNLGSLALMTLGGHGVINFGAAWWVMQLHSPDLSAQSDWQQAKGYTMEVAECMGFDTTLYATLVVRVYDVDWGQDRYFFSGSAQPLIHAAYNVDNIWNHLSFDWSALPTFPSHYIIREIYVNIWGSMDGLFAGGIYLDEVMPQLPGNTPAGSNVAVNVTNVTVTYETVSGSGQTDVTQSVSGHGMPQGFELACRPSVYYDITTTAIYNGAVEVCIQYDDTICNERNLHLFHYEGSAWVEVTSSVDTTANKICGTVTSLSEFLLASPTPGLGCSDYDIHTATADTISSNWSVIDHPLTNGNPDALLFVTQHWAPGGGNGIYNDQPIGVWYDGTQWAIFNQYTPPGSAPAMPSEAAFNFCVIPFSDSVFTHTATAANIVGHRTVIDHPLTNGNPDALLFVTSNWNPGGGVGGIYNGHEIGVWYNGSRWEIFNEDFGSVPVNATFNVMVVLPSESAFVHTATAANIDPAHRTVIDHPRTNGNPDAVLLVTQNWNPGGGVGGTYNNNSIGVWYNGLTSRWEIFNEYNPPGPPPMPVGAAFNVMVMPSSDFFTHTCTVDNKAGIGTEIDHPAANGNSNAALFVTQNWNPGGVGGTYNNAPISVRYASFGRWIISNEDWSDTPIGAAFNVKVAHTSESVFTHTATPDNITANSTAIDHPFTNGNPDAILLVTKNWNPGGGAGGVSNNAPIGVWYDNSRAKWGIFNENMADMPWIFFNVKVVLPSESAFVHTATAANIVSHRTVISHQKTNGNPNAVMLVTPNWNPGGVGGTYNNATIGVWYNSFTARWEIFNENFAGMPENAAFNVMVLTECDLSCVPCACHDADFNGDGIVNLTDFAKVAQSWLQHELPVDLAWPNGIVDILDLDEFAEHWLEQCP